VIQFQAFALLRRWNQLKEMIRVTNIKSNTTSGTSSEARIHYELERLIAEWEVVVPELGKYSKTHREMVDTLQILKETIQCS